MNNFNLEGFQIRYIHGQTIFFEKEDEYNLLEKFKEYFQIKDQLLKFSFYFNQENDTPIIVQYRNINNNNDFDFYNWCGLENAKFEIYKNYIWENFVNKI